MQGGDQNHHSGVGVETRQEFLSLVLIESVVVRIAGKAACRQYMCVSV